MKVGKFGVVAVFLLCSVAICGLVTGLYLLAGGAPAPTPGQESGQPSETEKEAAPVRGVIIIDAGHGGEDGGAVGVSGLVEKDLNLDIAKRLCTLLEAEGFTVIMTRTEDVLLYDRGADYKGRKKALDLAARQAIGDANPDAVFVSIHANAFTQQQYHGLQIWYGGNHVQSGALAEEIRAEVVSSLQPDNHRQSKQAGSNIYLLYHLQNPAVLIECGFLSNPAECASLEDADYRDRLAHALCRGIVAYDEGNTT